MNTLLVTGRPIWKPTFAARCDQMAWTLKRNWYGCQRSPSFRIDFMRVMHHVCICKVVLPYRIVAGWRACSTLVELGGWDAFLSKFPYIIYFWRQCITPTIHV
jgi:hypothetical protein